MDVTFTAGTPQAAALLAAGQADMATLSCSALAAGLLKDAFPSGVTIVSDNYQDGHAGNASNAFFVLEESPIKDGRRPPRQDRRGERLRLRGGSGRSCRTQAAGHRP